VKVGRRNCSLLSVIVLLGSIVAEVNGVGAQGDIGSGEGDERAKVLIIGDSVFDAFDHVGSAWRILSALDQLCRYSGQFTDAVVIGTGYNDRIGPAFRQAVLAITTEAASAVAGA